ncbi:MAG: tetratricopeptide repeat protein [Planctomycetes bacterium]|nr:tetratricopeptide repeat protein [Planctomycetota bacterium]
MGADRGALLTVVPDVPPDAPEDEPLDELTGHLRVGEAPLLDPGRQLLHPRRISVAVGFVAMVGLCVLGVRLVTRKSPIERAADLRRIAAEMLDSSHPEDASRLLTDALAIHPGDAETLHMFAAAAMRRGRYAEAEDALRRALIAHPTHVGCNTLRGQLSRALGRNDEAEQFLGRAVDAAGPGAAPYFARADVRLEEGDLDGALADLRAGLDGARDRESAARCVVAGHVADFLGRTTWSNDLRSEADECYRRAPGLSVGRNAVEPAIVAEAQLCGGRTRAALTALDQAPDDATTTVVRAEALRVEGAHEDAEALLRDAMQRADAAPLHAALVRLFLDEDRLRSAAGELADSTRRFPADVGLLHAGSAVATEAAIAADPGDLVSAALVVDPSVFNPMEALFATRVIEHANDVGSLRVAVAILWPGCARPRADVAPAVASDVATDVATATSTDPTAAPSATPFDEALRRLLVIAPDDPYAHLWLGASRMRRGDAKAAMGDLDLAVAASDQLGLVARARLVRAIARTAEGEFEGALRDVRAAVAGGAPARAAAGIEAELWMRWRKPLLARGVARLAAARWPDDLRVAYALARALTTQPGETADAELDRERDTERDEVETRLALASMDPDAVRAAVRKLSRQGDFDASATRALAGVWVEAATVWAEREREHPDDPEAALGHARTLVRAGRSRQADAVLRRAQERVTDDRLMLARVHVLASLGRLDAATDLLRSQLLDRPTDPRFRLEAAWLQIQSGEGAAAAVALRALFAATDVPPATRTEAALSLLTDDRVAAADADAVLAWLATAPPGTPDDVTRHVLTGYARLALGAPDEAILEAEAVLGRTLASPDAAVLAARAWLASGRPDRAETMLSRVLSGRCDDRRVRNLASHVRLLLGLDAQQAGDDAAASGWWESAITGGELDCVAAAAIADLYARKGDVGATFAVVRRVGAERSHFAAGAILRGHCAAVLGRDDVALAEYSEALTRDPSHPAVLTAYVGAAVRSGEFAAALVACRRAIYAGDRLGVAHALLAGVLVRGQVSAGPRTEDAAAVEGSAGEASTAEAIAALRVACDRDPGDFVALADLVDVLRRGGGGGAAASVVAAAVAREATPRAAGRTAAGLARARLVVETGSILGSIDRLRDVLSGRLGSWRSSFAMGRALAMTGSPEGARSWFERAVFEAPDEFAPQAALLRVLTDLDRLDEAERRLAERTSDRPGDAGAWCLLGMIADHRKDPEMAEHRYRRALAVAPHHALASNELACILFDRPGRADEAIAFAAAAVRARPEVPELAATHAWLLLRAGHPDAAAWALDDAVRLHPDFALIRLHRAEAALARSQTDAAVAEYRTAVRLDPSMAARAGAALRAADARARR